MSEIIDRIYRRTNSGRSLDQKLLEGILEKMVKVIYDLNRLSNPNLRVPLGKDAFRAKLERLGWNEPSYGPRT